MENNTERTHVIRCKKAFVVVMVCVAILAFRSLRGSWRKTASGGTPEISIDIPPRWILSMDSRLVGLELVVWAPNERREEPSVNHPFLRDTPDAKGFEPDPLSR